MDLAERLDGWTNTMTGHGTSRDKVIYGRFTKNNLLSDEYLDNMYAFSRMVRKICRTYPEQYLKKDFDLRITINGEIDVEKSKLIKDRMDILDTRKKYTLSFIWASVFGGSGIFIGADDGSEDLAEPLNKDNIETIDHLNILDKRDLTPMAFYDDPTHPKYGLPELYQVNVYSGSRSGYINVNIVHESRFIMFEGIEVSNQMRKELNGWDLSLIQNIYDSLRSYGMGMQSLDHLLYDANQGVLKFKGYMNYIAKQDYSIVKARLEAMDISRSIVRALVVDADEEDFERQKFNWLGIDKPYNMLMLDLSAASNIPVSILMGREPSGLNSTGDADFQAFYDRVASDQQNKVKPKLIELAYLLCAAEGFVPEAIDIKFESLYELPLDKQAEVRLKTSETDRNNIELGLVTSEEVQNSRFTKDGWSIETFPDLEMRGRLQKAEKGALELQNKEENKTINKQDEGLNESQIKLLVDIASRIGAENDGISESQARGILILLMPNLSEKEINSIVKVNA